MAFSDDQLEHMCKLSVITIDLIRNPDNGITIPEVNDKDASNMLNILAETFIELMKRQEIKPRFGK